MWEILILKWFLLLKILVTMIIGIGLYKLGIGFFFITKTITSWSLTMTITNGHLINNYALEWPFLIIMCWNDESLGSFWFWSFFGNNLKATGIVFMLLWLCASWSLVNVFFISIFFPTFGSFMRYLFCNSFALKQYECAFFVSNAQCLSHSFVLVSFLLITIWNCLILIITFIRCQLASKKCAFMGETFYVFVVVCITPSTSFC
jgi:hypothetical protein